MAIITPEMREKARQWHLGRKMSEYQRKALLLANIGRKQSVEERKKRSDSLKGRTPSLSTRLAVSEANRNRIWTTEMRQSHWNFRNGKRLPYPSNWNEIKLAIKRRDGFHCLLCGTTDFGSKYLTPDVHHIDGDKLNSDPLNMISLCHKCHCSVERRPAEWATRLRDILMVKH